MDNLKKNWLIYLISGLFLITTILILLGRSTILTPDGAYHLKTGEWILEHKTLPKSDIYSWHTETLTFILHEWLYEVMAAFIHKLDGMTGLTLFASFLVILSYLVSMKWSKTYVLSGLISVLLVICNIGKQIMLLPDSFGILLLLISLMIMISNNIKTQTKFILVFIVSILMANIHGGMLMTLFILSLFLCIIESVREKRLDKDRFILVAFAFVGGMINPYGISIYQYIGVVGTQSAKYNSDYATYQFAGILSVCLFIGLQVLIVMGYIKKHQGKIILTDEICLYVAFIAMFLTYQRMVNLYTYGLIAFGSPYIETALEDINSKIKKTGVITACIISLFFSLVMIFGLSIYKGTADDYIRQYLLSDEILSELDKDDVVLYNNVDAGGYLIYENIPVFMDGRTETYTHEYGNHDYWLESVNIDSSPEYMKTLNYGFTHILLRKNSYEANLYGVSDDWKIKSSTDNFILFTKK